MKTIRKTLAETGQAARLIARGPDLDVLPSAGVDIVPHTKEQVIQLACIVSQWLAMIGERQRDQSPPRQPTLDTAKDKAIGQSDWPRACSHNGRIVTIGNLQGSEPVCTMKD